MPELYSGSANNITRNYLIGNNGRGDDSVSQTCQEQGFRTKFRARAYHIRFPFLQVSLDTDHLRASRHISPCERTHGDGIGSVVFHTFGGKLLSLRP